MSKKKKIQNGRQISNLEGAIKQKRCYEELDKEYKETLKKYQEFEKAYQDSLNDLDQALEGEQIEKLLKNEAYAFFLAEGLLDKFLEFREYFHRTKAQDALYNLTTEANLGGLWIDL